MTPGQLRYLQDIYYRALPGVPLPDGGGQQIVDSLLRAALKAKGTLDGRKLNRWAFAAMDVLGLRRRELPDLIAQADAAPSEVLYLHIEERKNG